ncbi:MAG: hypothetical protein CMF49_01465 [Legionellales bacterium]|nr:hypothetical protein [Legionellales bacterium]|tara:strand:- start:8 stop:472 length:465 start_codon:yes stop_codon:yes gene_type:complete
MKTSYKHLALLLLVFIALASIFIPMSWEKDLYPKHFLIKRHAQSPPTATIKTIPNFQKNYIKPIDTKIPIAWTVQVASLKDKNKAAALSAKFRAQGYAAFLAQAPKESQMYRVLLGPYSTNEKAKSISQSLNNSISMHSIVTEYRTNEVKEIPS